MKPFMRWVGGKRWLEIPGLFKDLPRGSYCEPFVGSGAWLIQMMKAKLIEPGQLVIGDLAPECAVIWRAILSNPVRTAAQTRLRMERIHDQKSYAAIVSDWNHAKRGSDKAVGRDLSELGGIALAINRVSFKGLLRVNATGQFNTAYGYLSVPTLDDTAVIAVGTELQRLEAVVYQVDWRYTLDVASKLSPGVLAVDPPYVGLSDGVAVHTRYTEQGWNALDRIQLSTTCHVMHRDLKWSVVATDDGNKDAWKAWEWGNPVQTKRNGGMSDGAGSGRHVRSEIAVAKRAVL